MWLISNFSKITNLIHYYYQSGIIEIITLWTTSKNANFFFAMPINQTMNKYKKTHQINTITSANINNAPKKTQTTLNIRPQTKFTASNFNNLDNFNIPTNNYKKTSTCQLNTPRFTHSQIILWPILILKTFFLQWKDKI